MDNRVLIGRDANGITRFRVSKAGNDALANLNPTQLILDSNDIQTFFVAYTGSTFVDVGPNGGGILAPGGGTVSFPNKVQWASLGFIPAVVIVEQRSNSNWRKIPMYNHRTQVMATGMSITVMYIDTNDPGDWNYTCYYAVMSYPEGGVFG